LRRREKLSITLSIGAYEFLAAAAGADGSISAEIEKAVAIRRVTEMTQDQRDAMKRELKAKEEDAKGEKQLRLV